MCINAIIASLLYKFSPDQLRFVMIDPKVVEMQHYNTLPHLVVPVVTDPKKVILALRWVVNEMEKRYQIFAKVGVRNIATFNGRPNKKLVLTGARASAHGQERRKSNPARKVSRWLWTRNSWCHARMISSFLKSSSYIVVIIDELADH